MVRLNSHGDRPALRFGTVRFQRAWLARFHRELDCNDLGVIAIDCWCPARTLVPCRTCRFLHVPIDLEEAFVEALFFFPLPLVISSGWSDQIDAILLAVLNKLLGLGHNWCPSNALSRTSPF